MRPLRLGVRGVWVGVVGSVLRTESDERSSSRGCACAAAFAGRLFVLRTNSTGLVLRMNGAGFVQGTNATEFVLGTNATILAPVLLRKM